jgi:uncharacterized protein YggE
MARMHGRWSLVLTLTAVAAAGIATTATAQDPAPDPSQRTVTVVGTGESEPKPRDRKSNASIAKAVRDAERVAIPRALGNGRGRAARLAQQSGLRLLELHSVAETIPSPFGYYGPYGAQGTFGPGRYCGTTRRSIFRRGADGQRRRVGSRSVRSCRVPRSINASLTMTFTVA